jgi:hypothetical protein
MNTYPLDAKLPVEALPPIALDRFIELIGVCVTTVWRWRKAGMLTTVNICGRQYVHVAELIRFNARAAAGEFAKAVRSPRR